MPLLIGARETTTFGPVTIPAGAVMVAGNIPETFLLEG